MIEARTPRFLMANLGSEVSRLLRFKEEGDREMAYNCLAHAQKILAQIIVAPEMKVRENELQLLADVINDILSENPKYDVSGQELTNYLFPFAESAVRSFQYS